MDKFLRAMGMIVVGALVLAFVECFFAYPVKWIVNYLIDPAIIKAVFKTPQLSFWQALALTWVCGILFKGTSSSSK